MPNFEEEQIALFFTFSVFQKNYRSIIIVGFIIFQQIDKGFELEDLSRCFKPTNYQIVYIFNLAYRKQFYLNDFREYGEQTLYHDDLSRIVFEEDYLIDFF